MRPSELRQREGDRLWVHLHAALGCPRLGSVDDRLVEALAKPYPIPSYGRQGEYGVFRLRLLRRELRGTRYYNIRRNDRRREDDDGLPRPTTYTEEQAAGWAP